MEEDHAHDAVASPTNLTSKVQNIFESFSKMSESNININKKQIMTNMDKVFEAIKTKIEPCAEGEIPTDRRSLYWSNDCDFQREPYEMGRHSSPLVTKKQSVIASSNGKFSCMTNFIELFSLTTFFLEFISTH